MSYGYQSSTNNFCYISLHNSAVFSTSARLVPSSHFHPATRNAALYSPSNTSCLLTCVTLLGWSVQQSLPLHGGTVSRLAPPAPWPDLWRHIGHTWPTALRLCGNVICRVAPPLIPSLELTLLFCIIPPLTLFLFHCSFSSFRLLSPPLTPFLLFLIHHRLLLILTAVIRHLFAPYLLKWRSVGPIVWETKKYYREWRRRGISYIQ